MHFRPLWSTHQFMLFTKFIFLIFVWITEGSNWFLWQWVRQMCVTVFDKRHCTSRDVQSQHLREWNQRTDFDERKLLDTNKHSCLHIENLKSCPRRYKLIVLFFFKFKSRFIYVFSDGYFNSSRGWSMLELFFEICWML